MEDPQSGQSQPEMDDPKMSSLKYQLELLKMEVHSIDQTIERMDEITQTTKNWAIVTWAGSIAIAVGQPDTRRYIVLTAVLPLLFWYIDAHWRHLQRRSSFRILKIQEFLNDERLVKSFEEKRLVGFTVFDPTGRQYKDTDEYNKFISIRRTLRYPEVRVFYMTLALISLGLGLLFIFVL